MTPGALAWIDRRDPHQTGSCSVTIRGGKAKVKRALAVASTGTSGQIAQSTRRLTLAFGTTTKTRG
jgi:hypothetical protein